MPAVENSFLSDPLFWGNPYTSTSANSEDSDKIQRKAPFYLGPHCL